MVGIYTGHSYLSIIVRHMNFSVKKGSIEGVSYQIVKIFPCSNHLSVTLTRYCLGSRKVLDILAINLRIEGLKEEVKIKGKTRQGIVKNKQDP